MKNNLLPFRFMAPGMTAFFLFTILPIFFSVFISFTNLGTGHFFSKEEAKKTLLSEKTYKEEGLSAPFLLFREGKSLFIQVSFQDSIYIGLISQTPEKERIYLKEEEARRTGSPLPYNEVYKERPRLSKKLYVFPTGKEMIYHRVDSLIEGRFLFKEGPDNTLINVKNKEVFFPDNQIGKYKSKKSILEPGFYTFVGLKNFKDLFERKDFRDTFLKVGWWTLVWALVSVFLTFTLGMSLALFLNEKGLKFKAIYRNLLILPYSIPFFISVLVFKGMLNKDFGVINHALSAIGIGAIPWLEDALWAKVSCLLVNLWLGFPYMFLLTTGILQSIPESVYEAARIDGANKWQSFKSITLPMILNSITPLLIGAFAFNLGNFVGIYLLTGGGPAMADATTPAGETDILISYTYRLAFEGAMGQQFGLASTIALFIFILIGALTAINFKIFNKEEERS